MLFIILVLSQDIFWHTENTLIVSYKRCAKITMQFWIIDDECLNYGLQNKNVIKSYK